MKKLALEPIAEKLPICGCDKKLRNIYTSNGVLRCCKCGGKIVNYKY